MKRIVGAVALLALLVVVPSATASVEPLEPGEAGIAAQAIMAEPLQLTGSSLAEYPYEGPEEPQPMGIGSTAPPAPEGLTGFPTAGSSFGILSTGDVSTIGTLLTNESESTTTEFESEDGNQEARGEGANDWTVLRLEVEVPGADNCLALDYRFLSEEFPEYVGSEFNDAFIAEIDTTSWAVTPSGEIMRPNDFAASTTGTPISVNGVGPAAVSPAEAAGTYFDAATGLITTKTPITPGPHNVYLSIFDSADKKYDSAVFLDNLRFINESPDTCRPPVSAELVVPPPGSPPPPSNSFSVGPHVKFKNGGTQATIIVIVPGPGTVLAGEPPTASSSSARQAVASRLHLKGNKKRKRLLRPASVHAGAAGAVKLTVKLTGAGKKILAHKRKLKVPLEVTFTPDGGSAASQDMSLTFKKPGKAKHGKKHH